MYLKVHRLSEIVTNDGLHFQEQYLRGRNPNPYITHEWPRQERPDDKAWKLWKSHLERTFYCGSRLITPLGK